MPAVLRPADPADPAATALRLAFVHHVYAVLGQEPPGADELDPDTGLVPPDGAFWLASLDGRDVGCAGVRALGHLVPATVELKRLYVDPAARGHRIGRRLVEAAEAWATERGAARMVLDTRSELTTACTLYRAMGYVEVAPYNDNDKPDLWFAKTLEPRP